jgi:hypothetical protein
VKHWCHIQCYVLSQPSTPNCKYSSLWDPQAVNVVRTYIIDPYFSQIRGVQFWVAGPSGLRGLRPLSCWDCGFVSHRRTWMSVCCECCVLSGRNLCDEPITRPDNSYRLWCAVECDLETSWMRRPCPSGGCCAKNKRKFGVTEELTENAMTVKTPSQAWVHKPHIPGI